MTAGRPFAAGEGEMIKQGLLDQIVAGLRPSPPFQCAPKLPFGRIISPHQEHVVCNAGYMMDYRSQFSIEQTGSVSRFPGESGN